MPAYGCGVQARPYARISGSRKNADPDNFRLLPRPSRTQLCNDIWKLSGPLGSRRLFAWQQLTGSQTIRFLDSFCSRPRSTWKGCSHRVVASRDSIQYISFLAAALNKSRTCCRTSVRQDGTCPVSAFQAGRDATTLSECELDLGKTNLQLIAKEENKDRA